MRDTRATSCWVLLRKTAAWLIIYRLMLCVCEIIMYVKRWLLLEKIYIFYWVDNGYICILFYSDCSFRFFLERVKLCHWYVSKRDIILRIYWVYYYRLQHNNMCEQRVIYVLYEASFSLLSRIYYLQLHL